MKKIIALLLALIMAFGCASVAFAEDPVVCTWCSQHFETEKELVKHMETCVKNPNNATDGTNYIECPMCGNKIAEASYNAHIEICYGQQNNGTIVGDITIANLFERFINVFDINAAWLDGIEGVVIRIMDLFEHIALYIIGKIDVDGIKGAVADDGNGSAFILNTANKTIHKTTCWKTKTIAPENIQKTNSTVAKLEAEGYVPCKICNP